MSRATLCSAGVYGARLKHKKKTCINVNHKQAGLDFVAFCSFLKV